MEFVTSAEAAQRLGLTRAGFNRLAREGHVRFIQLASGARIFRPAEIDRLAREGWPGRVPARVGRTGPKPRTSPRTEKVAV